MKNICLFISLFSLVFSQVNGDIERRAAIDIGSGGTKVAIADVDTETNQIVEVLLDQSFPVPYQNSLDKSADSSFDAETQALGLKTFKQIKEIADSYQVQKIVAIATSAFRKASNAKEYVADVKSLSDIDIKIIPQMEEGKIAFFSAIATGEFDAEEVVVWDIGTGSLQMTTSDREGGLSVYMGEKMGSVAFKNYIISALQGHHLEEVNTPNPMSLQDFKRADSYARAFGRKAYPLIKEKIATQKRVVGIGRLFYQSIRPLASEGEVITRDGLRGYIANALEKSDAELDNPFAHVDVSNSILALGIMKALHIQEVLPIETTTTKGLLVTPDYWCE